MATDGINRLIATTQLKSANANDEAMIGADNQRKLIGEQKSLRADVRTLETKISDHSVTDKEYWEMKAMLEGQGLSTAGVDGSWSSMLGHYDAGHEGEYGHWKAELGDADQAKKNAAMIEQIKGQFQDAIKDTEAKDKLGNVEINLIMSDYNQAETLASSVEKKKFDTLAAITSKI